MLKEKLENLKKEIIEFAGLAERMLNNSMSAVLEGEVAKINKVYADEEKANHYELCIDEMCINLIAQYQPIASDLRKTMMILKMGNDLERIADLSTNICEDVSFMVSGKVIKHSQKN